MRCRTPSTLPLLRRVNSTAAIALVTLVTLTWLPAVAGARARSGKSKSLANARAQLGKDLYASGEYAEALVEYQKAYKLFPKPSYLFNMGMCFQKLGRLGQALEHFKRYLAEGGKRIGYAVRRRVMVKIKEILRISTAVTLEVEPTGAVIHIDREKVGTAPLPGPVRLRNGTHKVVITHPDHAKLTKVIEVGRKLPKAFSFKLQTTGRPPPRLTSADAWKEKYRRTAMLEKGFVLNPGGLRVARSGKRYWMAGLVVLSLGVVFGIAGSVGGFSGCQEECDGYGYCSDECSPIGGILQTISLVNYLVGFPLLAYGTGRQIDGIIVGSNGKAKGAGRGARTAGYLFMILAGVMHVCSSVWMGFINDETMQQLGGGLYYISLAFLVTGTALFIANSYSGWDTEGQDKAARRKALRPSPIQNLRIGAGPARRGGVMTLGFDF
jgi:hypothetical protein